MGRVLGGMVVVSREQLLAVYDLLLTAADIVGTVINADPDTVRRAVEIAQSKTEEADARLRGEW